MPYGRKRTVIFSTILIIALLSQPMLAVAQTSVFNPGSTLNMNNNSIFGGVTFNGVGQAIAACTNAGDTLSKWTNNATNGIQNLFKAKSKDVVNPNANPITPMSSSGANPPNLDTNTVNQHIQSITGQKPDASGDAVPVIDKTTVTELQKANKRESCLKAVAYATAQNALAQILNRTMAYVNTGFNGNPLYVRDIGSYLNSVANEETWKFINKIPTDNPIFGNALRSLATESVTGIQDGLLNTVMDTPQARAYQSFQDDFTNGGWEAFLDPSNNPFDAVFNAADNLGRNISSQQQDVQDQLQRNSGFLDVKRCVEYAPTDDATAAAQEQAALTITPPGSSKIGGCLTWETVTPGSIISAQVNAITTSRIRQLEQSDQINAVLGSFFDEVLNNLYQLGLNALRGKSNGSTFTFGGLGSNTIIGSNGTPINTSVQNALGYSSTTGSTPTEFDVSRPQQIRAVLQAQYDYLNRAQDAKAAESRLIPVLGALDYCIPGPNPTWKDGLDENINTYARGLQVEATNGSGGGTGGTIGAIVGTGATLVTGIPGLTQVGQALGTFLGNIFDNGKPHALLATDISLYDKVTGGPVAIRNSKWRIKGHSPNLVFVEFQNRLKEVLNIYNGAYTKDAITTAFTAVDPANTDFAKGFVETSFDETSKLPQYDQALAQIDDEYASNIANTKDAIAELESIRQEADAIVATAKARYIAQQKAAGTPVNEACLNSAYKLDNTPITASAPRVETDMPSPYASQMSQGTDYFYNHL